MLEHKHKEKSWISWPSMFIYRCSYTIHVPTKTRMNRNPCPPWFWLCPQV